MQRRHAGSETQKTEDRTTEERQWQPSVVKHATATPPYGPCLFFFFFFDDRQLTVQCGGRRRRRTRQSGERRFARRIRREYDGEDQSKDTTTQHMQVQVQIKFILF